MNFLIKSLSGKKYFQGYTELGLSGENTGVLKIIELVQLCSLCAHENVDVAIILPRGHNTPGPYKKFQEERIHVLLVLDKPPTDYPVTTVDPIREWEDSDWEKDVLDDFFQQIEPEQRKTEG